MELKDIASVSGKSGLFKVLKPTRTGVILESLDESQTKLVANMNSRISVLNEISIYTTTKEGAVPLEEVFQKMHQEFGNDLGMDTTPASDELKSFFKHILPDYDVDRVYVSDIKKVVNWYKILLEKAPSVITEIKKTEEGDSTEEKGEEEN